MGDGLRLAIVGLNYAPEEIGIARYTTDMAKALAARGAQVEVISGKPYYPAWFVEPEWRGGWRRSVEDGVSITRCPFYVPRKPGGLKRILHLASFTLSALSPALALGMKRRDKRPQAVFCIAPSLLSVPVAWVLARLSGASLWVHVQDFEVEAAFATGLVGSGGAAARLARWVENRMLGLADIASSISPQMCERLVAKGITADRVVEVRNWADVNTEFCSPQHSPYRQEWGIGQRKVCLYSGNIANKQGIEILIEAARLLRHRADIQFVICGQGPNRVRLEELARGLDNVMLHDLQPMARMGELLGLAQVHLLPQIPGAADLVLPSKLTNMLASGRPVVATAEPGTGLYDEVDGCGLAVAPGDAAGLAHAIERLIDEPEMAARFGVEARKRAQERWSQAAMIDRIEARLARLLRPGVAA
ncbi:WcaI family glycosyltransferase [Novosphingobium humi]|uniref:WcaI family glycosyltransferase n=1 Tax=Novosphingobium humi TaxID=2282397 RepID=UPI0025B1F035|nr:WcaI family glycosyltransferase [Novosphingobium humi]WJS99231.1 WcaI family glycosyltransferase [Novosphingobium humi]